MLNERRWEVVALVSGGVMGGVAFGVSASFGLFLKPITDAENLKRQVIGLAVGLNMLVQGFSSIGWGALTDTYGAAPVMVEKGPYAIQEKRVKVDVSFDEELGTVTYKDWVYADFDPFLSCDDCSLDDSITNFNPVWLTVLSAAGQESLGFLGSIIPTFAATLAASGDLSCTLSGDTDYATYSQASTCSADCHCPALPSAAMRAEPVCGSTLSPRDPISSAKFNAARHAPARDAAMSTGP